MDQTAEPQEEAQIRSGPIAQRLQACRDRLEELQEATKAERSFRDQLIAQAHDEDGMKYPVIARHAGVAKTTVIRVLAKS